MARHQFSYTMHKEWQDTSSIKITHDNNRNKMERARHQFYIISIHENIGNNIRMARHQFYSNLQENGRTPVLCSEVHKIKV